MGLSYGEYRASGGLSEPGMTAVDSGFMGPTAQNPANSQQTSPNEAFRRYENNYRNATEFPEITAGKTASGRDEYAIDLAKRQYGERWREGLTLITAANHLKTNQWGSPIVQPGQTLQAPPLSVFDDEQLSQYAQSANKLVSRNQQGLQVKAQIEARQAALAQAQSQAQDYQLMMSGGSRGGTGAAYGDAPTAAAASMAPTAPAAAGRYVDYVRTDATGAVTGTEREWVSDKPQMGYLDSVGKAFKGVAALVDGVVELGVKGSYNAIGARPASGVMALPALLMGGTQAYADIQKDLQHRLSAEIQNPGGKAIEQTLGQFMAPAAQMLTQARNYSESQLGDGWTTGLFATGQFTLEVVGFAGGAYGLRSGAAALGLDGASLTVAREVAGAKLGQFASAATENAGAALRSGVNALVDILPSGSTNLPGNLRYQLGAVGDVGDVRPGSLMRHTALEGEAAIGANSTEQVLVYRGTNRVLENRVFDETGHILSDAGQRAYMEAGSLDGAYASSKSSHKGWVDIWGTEDQFVQAHGAFGTELKQAFGLDKTLISVTTDPAQAAYFSDGGTVYSGYVPRSHLLEQTLSDAGESEYLLTHGTDLLKPMSGRGPVAGVNSGTFYKVESGGIRGEAPLSSVQRAQVENYLSKMDMEGVNVRWVDDRNLNTGYLHGDWLQLLNIGSDVAPGNVGLGTLTANSRISIEGTLAHELVGHREAALAGRTQDIIALEEAQASIRAARFGPDLSSQDRFTLLRDAMTRLRNAEGGPIPVRTVKDQLYIQHR